MTLVVQFFYVVFVCLAMLVCVSVVESVASGTLRSELGYE